MRLAEGLSGPCFGMGGSIEGGTLEFHEHWRALLSPKQETDYTRLHACRLVSLHICRYQGTDTPACLGSYLSGHLAVPTYIPTYRQATYLPDYLPGRERERARNEITTKKQDQAKPFVANRYLGPKVPMLGALQGQSIRYRSTWTLWVSSEQPRQKRGRMGSKSLRRGLRTKTRLTRKIRLFCRVCYVRCLKSVQVLFNGITAVVVLTLRSIILK